MTEQHTTKRSWWFKLRAVAIVITLLGAGTILFLGWSANRRWEGYVATLRAAGEPLTFVEIEALRATVPERENGARVIERLAIELDAIRDARIDDLIRPATTVGVVSATRGSRADFFEGIPRSTIEPTRQFAEQHRETLLELSSLRDVDSGRFDLVFLGDPFMGKLPHQNRLRAASRLVSLAGTLALIDGDMKQAGQAVELELKLANMIHDEPTMVSRLIAFAIDAKGLYLLQNSLRVGEMSMEMLESLSDALADRASSTTMKWALWGERALYVEQLETAISGPEVFSVPTINQGEPPVLTQFSWVPTSLIRHQQLRGARRISSLIDVVDNPRALREAARRYEMSLDDVSKVNVLMMILPPLERALDVQVRHYGHLRSAQALVAAERFRLTTGRLPITPEQLVPNYLDEWPTDPFDGQPMRFASTSEGLVFYSVGENLIDDGGSVAPVEGEKRARDWGFRLFDLEHRGLLIIDANANPDE